MTEHVPKELRISMSPIPRSESSELEMSFESREIGSVTLAPGDLADFIEGLRDGFHVVFTVSPARQARRDVAQFASELTDADEQDD